MVEESSLNLHIFSDSDRRGAPGVGRFCARNGYVAVAINYRLSRPSIGAWMFHTSILTSFMSLFLCLSPLKGWSFFLTALSLGA